MRLRLSSVGNSTKHSLSPNTHNCIKTQSQLSILEENKGIDSETGTETQGAVQAGSSEDIDVEAVDTGTQGDVQAGISLDIDVEAILSDQPQRTSRQKRRMRKKTREKNAC